jgi:hypothetical protein
VEHLIHRAAPPLETTVAMAQPTREALVSWNARAPRGYIELAASFADGSRSEWLPYVRWSEGERRSLGERRGLLEIAVDLLRGAAPLAEVHIRSDVALDALWLATPPEREARIGARSEVADGPIALDVPAFSQYLAARPGERGWCSPAALAMLLAFWGAPRTVPEVAAAVYDAAYAGAGNWAFNAAFAGTLGFAAATAYLRDLVHVRRFLAAGIPLALSIAWRQGDLPAAPLPASAGHLVIVRGFTEHGAVLINDPAQPCVCVDYSREAFERAWLGHGGVAYLVAPRGRAGDLTALANS